MTERKRVVASYPGLPDFSACSIEKKTWVGLSMRPGEQVGTTGTEGLYCNKCTVQPGYEKAWERFQHACEKGIDYLDHVTPNNGQH